jgi:predicted transcriptional regulator
MVLGFKEQFVDRILNGSKIHTIREDSKSRWKQSIEKYFSQINNKIDRDLIIKMCTEGYLSKSYHKVEITKKGFDLIKKIKNK